MWEKSGTGSSDVTLCGWRNPKQGPSPGPGLSAGRDESEASVQGGHQKTSSETGRKY